VIAVALVLCAVFVPCTFIPELRAKFFAVRRDDFGLTVFSAINSLTLSPGPWPPFCSEPRGAKARSTVLVTRHVCWAGSPSFNKTFEFGTGIYTAYGGLVAPRESARAVGLTQDFWFAPIGIHARHRPALCGPGQGYLLLNVQLPDSASVQRTKDVVAQIEQMRAPDAGRRANGGIAGQSLIQSANAPEFRIALRHARGFEERRGRT